MIIDVDNLLGLAEIGDVAGVIRAAAFEARPDSLGAQTGKDAAAGLSVAGVHGANLETSAYDADEPARNVHVEIPGEAKKQR